jgi:hypothetical protein
VSESSAVSTYNEINPENLITASGSGGAGMIFHESRDNGWVPLRRNLIPHVEDERLGILEWAVLSMLIALADSDSGEVKTCSSALRRLFHTRELVDERGMRRVLDNLEAGGYIRRFRTQGQRGLYRVLINKYLVSTGDNAGKRSKIPPKISPKTEVKRDRDDALVTPSAAPDSGSEHGSERASGSPPESTGSLDQESVLRRDPAVTPPGGAPDGGSERSPIQQRNPIKTKRTETSSSGGGGTLTTAGEGDRPDSSFDRPVPDGTDIGRDPDEHGEGQSEPTDVDLDPYEAGQGQSETTDVDLNPDHDVETIDDEPADLGGDPDGDVSGPGATPPLDGDYIDSNPAQPTGDTTKANPARPAGSPLTQAGQLAKYFFELVGEPARYKDSGRVWMKIASAMLKNDSLQDIKAAAEYAMGSDYWGPWISQLDKDPFIRFHSKLPQFLIKSRGIENHKKLNLKPNNKSEVPHGGKPSARNKSKREITAEETLAAGERYKERKLRGKS